VARLVLVGLPGVGKTTVAHALAESWGCEAIDTDDLVSTSVAMSSAQYLRQFGETHFRERELDALRSALVGHAVVATGAGIVTTATAREMISHEFAIWLDADDDTPMTIDPCSGTIALREFDVFALSERIGIGRALECASVRQGRPMRCWNGSSR
jgi:shikimate kinase